MMTPPNNSAGSKAGNSLIMGIILVSVILNLFLVGLLAGIVPGLRHRHFGPMALGGYHGESMGQSLALYLEPQDATVFRAIWEPQRQALKQAHQKMHQAMADIATAFEQEPPDPTALRTALDHLAEARAETNGIVGQIIEAADTKLSPEGRHRLAELMH